MIRTAEYDYWVWRDNDTREPVCLARNSAAIPFSVCVTQVHEALDRFIPNDRKTTLEIADLAQRALHSDDDFTLAEWHTWFAFEICPSIMVYIEEPKTLHNTRWGWQWIKP